jgi:hypothetical protein
MSYPESGHTLKQKMKERASILGFFCICKVVTEAFDEMPYGTKKSHNFELIVDSRDPQGNGRCNAVDVQSVFVCGGTPIISTVRGHPFWTVKC